MRSSALMGTVIISAALAGAPTVSGQQSAQFGTTVSRVQVDVIVTDEDGNFLDGLERDDFVLYEDNELQELLRVEFIDLGTRVSLRLVESDDGTEYAQGAESTTTAIAPGRLGAVVFLIDLPSLYNTDKIRFADALVAVQREGNELSIPYAAYFVDQVGKLHELVPLTYSVERLLAAAHELRAYPLARSRDEIFRLTESLLDPSFLPSNMAQRRIDNLRERGRSFDTYEMLTRVVDSLSARRGRTALVWVSNGVEGGYTNIIQGTPRAAQSSSEREAPRRAWMNFQPDPAIARLQETLYRSANTASVSVYAIDPSRLVDLTDFGRSPTSPRAASSSETSRDSLRQVAEATGGEAYIAATELRAVLRDIDRDAGRFYLLTYAPSRDQADGEYHDIRVEVRRPDTRVRARRGYTHYDDATRHSRTINAALDLPGTLAGFEVMAQATRAWTAEGQPIVVLHLAVDRQELAMPAGSGPAVAPMLYAAVRDRDGRLVAQTQEVFADGAWAATGPNPLRPGTDEGRAALERILSRFDTPPDPATQTTLPPDEEGLVVSRVDWTLSPGVYEISVVVEDRTGDRLGATKLEVEVPDVAERWHTSDPALLAQNALGDLVPIFGGRIRPGQSALVYVEVYNGQMPIVGGTISLAPGPDTTALPTSPGLEMFELPLRPEEGLHRGSLPLPLLPPGKYMIELRIKDPAVGQQVTIECPIHILPAQ